MNKSEILLEMLYQNNYTILYIQNCLNHSWADASLPQSAGGSVSPMARAKTCSRSALNLKGEICRKYRIFLVSY